MPIAEDATGFDTAVYYVSMSTEGRLPKNPDCEEHFSVKKGGVLGRFRVGHLAAAVVWKRQWVIIAASAHSTSAHNTTQRRPRQVHTHESRPFYWVWDTDTAAIAREDKI